ncbi:hypothetical protein Hanom_Chr11g00993461 [Helianthus anomalus]
MGLNRLKTLYINALSHFSLYFFTLSIFFIDCPLYSSSSSTRFALFLSMAPGKDNLAESFSVLTQRQLDKFV